MFLSMLAAWCSLLVPPARAETRAAIVATVDPALTTIVGTLTLHADTPVTLADPLAALPVPTTDEVLQATFPGRPDRGALTWAAAGPDTWSFTARLPRRYGDIGAIHTFGLFANGGWYPQPVVGGGLPEAAWDVVVTLPDGVAGAIGDVAGPGTLRWTGRGERVSLAVVPRGVVTPIDAGGVHLDLLTRGPPRRVLTRFLAEQIGAIAPASGPRRGVVVEAPLRRSLTRPGVRLTYLSDRAWRLTPGFRRFHHVAVLRGAASALLDVPDPFARDIAAATLAADYRDALAGAAAADALKWVAWIPVVDKMLSGEHTPFLSEILEEALPGDPLRDDLVDVLDPHWPGSTVVAQVRDRLGVDAATRLGAGLAAGLPLADAATAAGVDPDWLAALRSPLPVQDYRLTVDRAAGRVVVTRDAPADAPAEVVAVVVDGASHPWLAGPGPATLDLPVSPPPRAVAVDPDHHVAQTTTAGDTWPTRFTPVFAAWFTRVDLRQLYFDGFAELSLRRQYDTHFVWKARIFADEQTLVGGQVGYTRMFGRPLDGFRREHRVEAWVSPAMLSARYAPTGTGTFVVGGGVTYTTDTRVAQYFPLRGHWIELGVDAGVSPDGGTGWRAIRGEGLGIVAPHPRFAVPIEVIAGYATGTVEHRLVDLGGLGGMRSLPPGEVIGNARFITRVEGRWAVVHNAAIPALVLWGNELSLSLGAEAGGAWVDGAPVAAVGVTGGVGWQVALLGANPSFARLRLGYPLWTRDVPLPDRPAPQVVFEVEDFF